MYSWLKWKIHSFMKHGFFGLKQFLSHITKFSRGFCSSGIFPFTGIYLAGFLHSPRFFFPLAGFFIPFDLNLWSLLDIRRFLKKRLEDFSLLVKKLSNIHVNVHPAGFFHSPGYFFIPHLNPCFSWRNVIPPFKRREEWHIQRTHLQIWYS